MYFQSVSDGKMPLNVLYESPVGFALFSVLDEGKLKEVDDVKSIFDDPSSLSGILQLKKFKKFTDQVEATGAAVALTEGKIAKPLKKMLKKLASDEVQAQLAVADSKLGGIIREAIGLECIHSPAIHELMRGIRENLNEMTGIHESERSAMALGLAHSLSRYKLKFSPDKVDTMIVQAISLLDDLDKELNNYTMRVREWYGWHFPEMGKVVTDNLAYAKTIKKMTYRTNCASTDFSDILPEEIEQQLKEFAEVSMGTAIGEDDMENIVQLADQVIEITDYRAQLFEYLKNRMAAIAPNLTVLVGDLVGARLIAHAGSLLNLAKHPASTVQILGAEKALFRALKTRQDTPKYGLIYHASMVGQAAPKHKGKVSRMLAAKAALAIRYDALAEGDAEGSVDFAIEARTALEKRARELELRKAKIGGHRPKGDKYKHKSEVVSYDSGKDQTIKRKKEIKEEEQVTPAKKVKKEAKEEPTADLDGSLNLPDSSEKPKKVFLFVYYSFSQHKMCAKRCRMLHN
jgi:nucleolar protein 58